MNIGLFRLDWKRTESISIVTIAKHQVTTQPETSCEIFDVFAMNPSDLDRMEGFVDWNRSQIRRDPIKKCSFYLTRVRSIQLYQYLTEPQLIFGLQIKCTHPFAFQLEFIFFFWKNNGKRVVWKRLHKYFRCSSHCWGNIYEAFLRATEKKI